MGEFTEPASLNIEIYSSVLKMSTDSFLVSNHGYLHFVSLHGWPHLWWARCDPCRTWYGIALSVKDFYLLTVCPLGIKCLFVYNYLNNPRQKELEKKSLCYCSHHTYFSSKVALSTDLQ